MKRRDFIKNSALASAGTMLVPSFLKAFEQATTNASTGQGKTLVIIQWSGGNDGLNTIVPYQNDIYYQKRPQLAISPSEVIKLSDEVGMNPAMQALQGIYDQGYLSIINQVGYPNPDRSHFRSMDIWHTASDADEYLSTGWLGRYLDASCEGNCQTAHQAIEVDDTLSLAMKGEKLKGLALQDPRKFHKMTQGRQMEALSQRANTTHEHESVSYLYKTLAETVSSADYIYDKSKVYRSQQTYPSNPLGRQLKTIAELINSGLETKVYYASVSGFDTHVNQKPQQERLLKAYAESMQAFVADLKANHRLQDTLIMTFSEFGRRVAQNASRGTDHGTANNVFIINGNLKKPGFYNEMPDLENLEQGDLPYQLDFRNIYATLLEKHLEIKPAGILRKKFAPLSFI